MNIAKLQLPNNLIMAPLAGITDLPFRAIVRRYGCGLCYSEMVSADGIVRGQKKTLDFLRTGPDDRPLIAQIFGSDPDVLAAAARVIESGGLADAVDINMGCPVRPVIRRGAGAALMKDPERVRLIVRQARKALRIPLTVKIRAGWSPKEINALEIARIAEQEGADAIAVHPRTASQGMSHEIRTPMNGIIGMTSLLLDTPMTPLQQEFAETIRSSSESLLTIINDILDFSKIEADKLELEKEPFDLRETIEGALDLMAAKASEKGVDLAYLIDPKTPTAIVGDATRLRQIILNLLGNALKFTETGEVVLSVTARPLTISPDPDQIPRRYEFHFQVSDPGISIKREQISRLFRCFSQVDSSTTRR